MACEGWNLLKRYPMTNFQYAQKYVLLDEGGFLQDEDGITYEGLCEKDTTDFEGWTIIKALNIHLGS